MSLAIWSDFEDTSVVAASIAVIGGAPNCAELVIEENTVTFHTELVSAENVLHIVHLKEFFHDLRTESVASASRRDGELLFTRIRVRPNEIGHRTFMGYFSEPVDNLYLIEGVDGGRETAVDAEDTIINNDAESEIVEHIRESRPDGGRAVFLEAFDVETVSLSDSSRFMVSAYQLYSVWISQFEAGEE